MNLSFFNFSQPFLFQQWSSQNFSLQYRYNNKKTSDENKKKKIPIRGLSIQYQILRNNITRGVWRMVTRITIEICEWEETDPFILEIDLDHLIFKSHSLLQISEIFFWRIRTLSYHVTTILVSCVTLIPWVGGSAYERTRYSCAVMFCFLIMRSSLFTGILRHTCP